MEQSQNSFWSEKDGGEMMNVNMADGEKRFLRIIKKIQNQRNRVCYQNLLEFAGRENENINMDICKAIIDNLVEKKLVVNKGKIGQGESFKIVDQICKEKDPPWDDTKPTESIEDLLHFFDDKFLVALTNMIQNEVKHAINKLTNARASDNSIVNESNKISLENNYLKETIDSQNKEIIFLRNELLSRDKIVEMLIGDKIVNNAKPKKSDLESKSNLHTENKDVKSKSTTTDEKFTEVKRKQSDNKHKRSIVVLGDSLLKGIEQHRVRNSLRNNEKVYVKHFSGATTSHMHNYVQPSKEFNNDLVILHCGTNDLRSDKQPLVIAEEIMELASEMKLSNNEVMVSGIVQRRDKFNEKGKEVNKLLQASCKSKDFYFIDNSNINPDYHLNGSGLHLNTRGTYTLGSNLVNAINL